MPGPRGSLDDRRILSCCVFPDGNIHLSIQAQDRAGNLEQAQNSGSSWTSGPKRSCCSVWYGHGRLAAIWDVLRLAFVLLRLRHLDRDGCDLRSTVCELQLRPGQTVSSGFDEPMRIDRRLYLANYYVSDRLGNESGGRGSGNAELRPLTRTAWDLGPCREVVSVSTWVTEATGLSLSAVDIGLYPAGLLHGFYV